MHAHQNLNHFQPTARVIRCLNIFTCIQGTRYCCRKSFGSTSFFNLSMSSRIRCPCCFRSANLSLNPYIHVCACVCVHVCVSSSVYANEKGIPHGPNTIMLNLYVRLHSKKNIHHKLIYNFSMFMCFEDSHTLTSAYTNACVHHVHFWRLVRIPPGSFSHFGFPETTRCNLDAVAGRKNCVDRERRERKGDRGSDKAIESYWYRHAEASRKTQ